MMKLGCPPTATMLPIAMLGISARPIGSSSSMLHEIIALREAAPGPIATFRVSAANGRFQGHSDTDTRDSAYRRQQGRLLYDARRSN